MLFCRVVVVVLLSNAVSSGSAFAPSRSSKQRKELFSIQSYHQFEKFHQGRSFLSMAKEEQDENSMKNEIENMRQEALRRIEALNSKVPHDESCIAEDKDGVTSTAVRIETTQSKKESHHHRGVSDKQAEDAHLSSSPPPSTTQKSSGTSTKRERDDLSLLHGTCWKLVFNIGREEARSLLPENAPTTRSGTWMPKTWGVSGERLLLSLEVEFKPDQLNENEEFLNGVAGAKELHVVNQELTLGPSLTEGRRKFPVSNGGWRVCKGEGPLGTDILRFFFRVAEEVSHRGSDVYCPAGKVFCTCGYFPQHPTKKFSKSTRESLREKQESLNRRYEQLSREVEEKTNLLSWDKVVKTKELLQLRVEAGRLAERVNEARVREPDKNLLRLSQNLEVGLTREGGACCKVPKGLFTEYQILGKFGLKAIAKKTSSEELLP